MISIFQDISESTQSTDDSTDNYVEALIDTVLANLAKCSRNVNSTVGYTPSSVIDIPFSRTSFWSLFMNYIPKNFSKMSKLVKFKLSVTDFNKALGIVCDKYIKPNSNTQVRIFGFLNVTFYEYSHLKNGKYNQSRYMAVLCI